MALEIISVVVHTFVRMTHEFDVSASEQRLSSLSPECAIRIIETRGDYFWCPIMFGSNSSSK